MTSARRLLIDCAAIGGIGLLLALLGPFGSFAAPFGFRLLYWGGLAYAGYFLYRPAMTLAARSAARLAIPEPAAWAAACLAATVPMSAVVWLIAGIWRPVRWPSPATAVAHYGNVLVVGAMVCLFFWLLRPRAVGAGDDASAAPAPPPAPRFLDRLPPHLGRSLLALEMEDHYVRAHTSAGSTLLLMRLRDAIAELDGIEGRQVHRSWWVARHAVVRSRREGRNVRLVLVGGLEAPVARGQVPALQAAGWLGRAPSVAVPSGPV